MAKTKAMRPSAAGIDDATRRKLERLREDCRRHPEAPVRLVWIDSPEGHLHIVDHEIERGTLKATAHASRAAGVFRGRARSERFYLIGGLGSAASERVLVWLDRLGRLAEHAPALGGAWYSLGWERGARIVLELSREVALCIPIAFDPKASHERRGSNSKGRLVRSDLLEIEIPDTAAALAAAIDELLLDSNAPKQVDAEEFVEPMEREADALGELWLLHAGQRKTGASLAFTLGIEERAVRALFKRLKEQGWPIRSKGAHGGGYSLESSLSRAQRDWLQSRWPKV